MSSPVQNSDYINQIITNRRGRQGRYQGAYHNQERLRAPLVTQLAQHVIPQGASDARESTTRPTQVPSWTRESTKAFATCSVIQDTHPQWGILNKENACVLKFITKLTQNGDCRVDRLTVDICFKENGPDNGNANEILRILENPCPTKLIRGEIRHEHVTRTTDFRPHLDSPALSFSAPGFQRTSETTLCHSWIYECNQREDVHKKPTIVQWKWNADLGDPRVQHINRLYSGVVLAHPTEAFWAGCKITFKLHSNLGITFKRFLGHARNGDREYQYKKITPSPTNTDLEIFVRGLDDEINRLTKI